MLLNFKGIPGKDFVGQDRIA